MKGGFLLADSKLEVYQEEQVLLLKHQKSIKFIMSMMQGP